LEVVKLPQFEGCWQLGKIFLLKTRRRSSEKRKKENGINNSREQGFWMMVDHEPFAWHCRVGIPAYPEMQDPAAVIPAAVV